MSESAGRQPGRRRVEVPTPAGGWSTSTVLAVVVPVLTLLAALLVNGNPVPAPASTASTEAPLTSLQLPCPSASGSQIGLGTVQPDASGGISLHLGGSQRAAKVASNRVTWVSEPGAIVADGRQGMAPGLLATRTDERHAAAVICHSPRPDTWFTGVGAASIHSSTLQLINPDSGPAIADVTLFSTHRVIDVPDLRGLTVPGGTVRTINLSETAPARSELAVHVAVARGRLGVSLLDSFTERTSTRDWISPQFEPSQVNTIVGVARGSGTRTLVVANPTDDEALVEVKVIGAQSTFAPEGFDEISVPPQSVYVRNVDSIIGTAQTQDAVGLLVTSSQPVTASVRSLVDDELSSAVAAPVFTTAGLVVPDGLATLVVAAPDEAGSAQVVAYSAGGKQLLDSRIAAKKLTGAKLALPAHTAYVVVTSETATLHGAVRIESSRGVITLPLEDVVTSGLIPAVRAGG
jgi:hypothetical protein